jgi:spore maturation protein A
MLNYVWGAMIVVSVLYALGQDIHAAASNRWRNGEPQVVRLLSFAPGETRLRLADGQDIRPVQAAPVEYRLHTGASPDVRVQPVPGVAGEWELPPGQLLPPHWREVARVLGADKPMRLRQAAPPGAQGELKLLLPEVRAVRTQAVMQGAVDAAEFAVKLALGLVGLMALWLGMLRIAEAAGLVARLVRGLAPLLRRIFPEVPPEHPAMGAISLNLAANLLGLGNAATPMGIKAMEELQRLNPRPDTASHSMCMFLALNTSSVQLLPPVTLLALLGAQAGGLFFSILIATACSTLVAYVAARAYARREGGT